MHNARMSGNVVQRSVFVYRGQRANAYWTDQFAVEN
jgi:hypothetical protein